MVTKIIACSDIHIPNFFGINDIKEILIKFIDICKNIADENGKLNTRIVICGDIFESKINVSNESIVVANWFFNELNKICKTIVVAGNHDLLVDNKDRLDSLTPIFEIGKFKNIVYIDKQLDYKSGCFQDDNVIWCLYSTFDGFNPPDIKSAKVKYDEDMYHFVGLIHGDINGAVTATNHVTVNGLDPNMFEDCGFVIAGHIHKKQEIKKNGVKIVYCSSIKQKDYGETITGHGFALWDLSDSDDYTYEYVNIENENGGFYKFQVNSINDIENDEEELINL